MSDLGPSDIQGRVKVCQLCESFPLNEVHVIVECSKMSHVREQFKRDQETMQQYISTSVQSGNSSHQTMRNIMTVSNSKQSTWVLAQFLKNIKLEYLKNWSDKVQQRRAL